MGTIITTLSRLYNTTLKGQIHCMYWSCRWRQKQHTEADSSSRGRYCETV